MREFPPKIAHGRTKADFQCICDVFCFVLALHERTVREGLEPSVICAKDEAVTGM